MSLCFGCEVCEVDLGRDDSGGMLVLFFDLNLRYLVHSFPLFFHCPCLHVVVVQVLGLSSTSLPTSRSSSC
jgi:hypothetical protein